MSSSLVIQYYLDGYSYYWIDQEEYQLRRDFIDFNLETDCYVLFMVQLSYKYLNSDL